MHIPQPPPERDPDPVFLTLAIGSHLVRIYNPKPYSSGALTFRFNGPRARFDHQRAPADCPSDDSERGITYTSFNLSGCIVEVFGDERVILCADWRAAYLTLTRPLKLLELRNSGAMRAGTVSAIGSVEDRVITQKWSRYFYESPLFQEADGLIFSNAHNGEPAIALYERAKTALKCGEQDSLRLDSQLLRADIIHIAINNNLIGPIV